MNASLPEIALILAPTVRSRAYVQMLEARRLRPVSVFYIPGSEPGWAGPAEAAVRLGDGKPRFRFRPGVPARETIERQGIPASTLPDVDINHPATVEALAAASPAVFVYSGLPKVLLRPPILASGKRFLHVHGGYVPAYRGATAFYFGLLVQGKLGQSAIWLDQGVDTGPLLMQRWYAADQGLDVDLILDPVARADLLADVLQTRLDTGAYPSSTNASDGESFFVIHPVLKHLALRRTRAREPALGPTVSSA